jgi:transposase
MRLPRIALSFTTPLFFSVLPNINQTKEPLRFVGYEIDGVKYWIATSRLDLSAEQIATIYKRRWDIETFFAWWKRHLKVYHLIARSEHGLMIQIPAGLITYLLLTIYCYKQPSEKVSIKRVRQLRNKILNEARQSRYCNCSKHNYDKGHLSFQVEVKT